MRHPVQRPDNPDIRPRASLLSPAQSLSVLRSITRSGGVAGQRVGSEVEEHSSTRHYSVREVPSCIQLDTWREGHGETSRQAGRQTDRHTEQTEEKDEETERDRDKDIEKESE